jgi:hypothetical protein
VESFGRSSNRRDAGIDGAPVVSQISQAFVSGGLSMSLVFAVLLVSAHAATDQQAGTPAQAEIPAPAKKPRKICKQDDQTSGSRMARRLCLTEEEWSQRARGMTNSNRSGFSGKSEDH